MFLSPALQHIDFFGFTASQYGVFAGASIHEVAQVVVAGSNVSPEAETTAVIVKMTRVLLLIPVLIICTFISKKAVKTGTKMQQVIIPWFALIFLGAIGFNSLNLLPDTVVELIKQFDTLLLTMAMGAIGMETNLNKIKDVGLKPFYLAIILFIWLGASAYFLVGLF